MMSPSRIISFYKNYNEWYEKYVLGKPQDNNVYFEVGTACHNLLEDFFKTPPLDGEDLKEFTTRRFNELIKTHLTYNKSLKKYLNESPVYSIEELQDWLHGYIKNWLTEASRLEAKYGSKNAFKFTAPSTVEEYVEDEDLYLRGHIDALYTENRFTVDSKMLSIATPVDYKTSSKQIGTVPKDYFLQLGCYALILENRGESVDWVSIHYLKYAEKHYFHMSNSFKESLKTFLKKTEVLMNNIFNDPDGFVGEPDGYMEVYEDLWNY